MALKYKYTNKQEIPAEQAALYVEREGAFYLDAEGVVDKAKADEMRNHNIELRKQIEDRDARFAGVDPDEFRRLAEEKRKLELQAQGHKPEEIDKRRRILIRMCAVGIEETAAVGPQILDEF